MVLVVRQKITNTYSTYIQEKKKTLFTTCRMNFLPVKTVNCKKTTFWKLKRQLNASRCMYILIVNNGGKVSAKNPTGSKQLHTGEHLSEGLAAKILSGTFSNIL